MEYFNYLLSLVYSLWILIKSLLSDGWVWLKENKDAALAFGAIAAPILSFWAGLAGVRAQQKTAAKQASLTEQNLALTRQQVVVQQRQVLAGMVADYEHKWIDAFREKLAEVLSLTELNMVHRIKKWERSSSYPHDVFEDNLAKSARLVDELRLMTDDGDIKIFPNFPDDLLSLNVSNPNEKSEATPDLVNGYRNGVLQHHKKVLQTGRLIIEHRRARVEIALSDIQSLSRIE